MNDKLNIKLEEIRKQKKQAQEAYDQLTKQVEQVRNNYIALDGAEQVLVQLIEESKE